MTTAFSCQNSISLCPASFCTSRPNLPVTPGFSSLPTFAFQSSFFFFFFSYSDINDVKTEVQGN